MNGTTRGERIVVLVGHDRNRSLLVDRLSPAFDVTTELPRSDREIGVIVVDEAQFERDHDPIRAVVEEAAPAMLPVLLVARDTDRVPEQVWNSVDEVIDAPVDGTVLENRIEMLLQLRRQSLALKRQQEESEHRFRQLFRAAPDPVLVVEEDGTIVDANDAFVSLIGRDLSAVKGSRVQDVGFEPESVLDRILLRVEDGDDPGAKTLSFVDEGGRTHVSELDAKALSTLGDSTERIGIFRDVTERVVSREGLEQKIDRLEEFSSIVSHDLRNPLNIALGHLDMLKEDYDAEKIETVETSLERMDALITDLLDFAKAGTMVTEPAVVNLASIVDETRAFLDEMGNATLVVEGTARIYADEDQLRRVFDNVFRNAVQHAGPDVTIWVGDTKDGFFIEDDGPGIPPEDREAVLDSGFTTDDGSSGLGLSIVATIAAAHGWDVHVEPGRAGGTKVVFEDVNFAGEE